MTTRDRRSRAALRALDPQRDAGSSIVAMPGLAALAKGDPCFVTPEVVIDGATAAARNGYTRYPPPLGDRDLREALAVDIAERTGRATVADEVIVTVGATGAIAAVLLGYLDQGDEALVLDPTYSGYAPLIRQAGARPVRVPVLDGSFRLDPDALARAITPRTKLVVLNNPGNPTGVVLDRGDLEALARVAALHDLLVVADEVYDRLLFDDPGFVSVLELEELRERALYVNSFSKTYAMTGWRVGYLCAPAALLEGPATLSRAAVNGVSWPAQRGALAGLLAGAADVAAMHRGYAQRRSALMTALDRLGGVSYPTPGGAFYVFARLDGFGALTSEQLAATLLSEGVAVRSGSEYGPAGEGYVRISYSAELEDIERGVAAIGGLRHAVAR